MAVEKQTNKQTIALNFTAASSASTCCHTITQVFSRSRTCISTQTNIQLLNASNYAHLLFTPPRRGYLSVSHPLRKDINFCYLVKLWPKYPRPKKENVWPRVHAHTESTRTSTGVMPTWELRAPRWRAHGSPSGNYRKLASSSPIFPIDTGYSLFVLY